MGLKLTLVGERQHLIVDTRGVAYAKDRDAAVDKLLGNPVDSHIALCADHDLILTPQALDNGLDKSGCLASAGRAVDNGHILGAQHLVDSMLLGWIKPWDRDGGEGETLEGKVGIEKVAKIGKTGATG